MPAAELVERPGPDGVDARMDQADSPGPQPVGDRPPAEAEVRELVAGDDAILAGGERSEPPLPLDPHRPAAGGRTWVVLGTPVVLEATHVCHGLTIAGESARVGRSYAPFGADYAPNL
jgi:hypothetical protein